MAKRRLTTAERANLGEILAAVANRSNVRAAIGHLKMARDLLAQAPNAQAKVRRALKSAEGAERHADGRVIRAESKPRLTL